jgi:hypothetical protein
MRCPSPIHRPAKKIAQRPRVEGRNPTNARQPDKFNTLPNKSNPKTKRIHHGDTEITEKKENRLPIRTVCDIVETHGVRLLCPQRPCLCPPFQNADKRFFCPLTKTQSHRETQAVIGLKHEPDAWPDDLRPIRAKGDLW